MLKQKGFTLIELIATVGVLGLMAGGCLVIAHFVHKFW